jgi:hypothetical protein
MDLPQQVLKTRVTAQLIIAWIDFQGDNYMRVFGDGFLQDGNGTIVLPTRARRDRNAH